MEISNILISFCLMSFTAEPEVDASRFGQLIRGLHSQIHDLTLAYEGGTRAGDAARAAGLDVAVLVEDYQGRYSYRSDGAAFLDFYNRGLKDDDRQSHTLLQNLGGVSSLAAVPDLNRLNSRPARTASKTPRPARPDTLSRPGSPERILFLWYLQGLNDPLSMHYEYQGWEEVEGHRCLRVELDSQAGARPEYRNRERLWIDLDRGGHPLRAEYFLGGKLFQRSEHIQLQQFKDAKGTSIWLPVSGQSESFRWLSKKKGQGEMKRGQWEIVDYGEPVLVETYSVITGSVVLNQGLSDADLTVGSNVTKYSEFKDFKGFQKERHPSIRTDPKGVQKRLDDALADADAKARRLEASAPERTSWEWSNVLSVGLPMLGVALLAWAGIWRWRSIVR